MKKSAEASVRSEKEHAPKWHERFLPPFMSSSNGAADTFYIGRMFMYQFEATYDYLRLQLSKFDFMKDAAKKLREVSKDFVGYQQVTVNVTKTKAVQTHPLITKNYTMEIKDAESLLASGVNTLKVTLSAKETRVNQVTKVVKETRRVLNDNWKRKVLGVLPFTRDVRGMRPLKEGATPGDKGATELYFGQEVPVDRMTPEGETFLFTRNLTNVLEALVFTALDVIGYRRYKKELLEDVRDTIHLSRNIPTTQVKTGDLSRDPNPFIRTEVSKNKLKYALRFIGDAAFVWGLKTGIIMKLLPYPLEYTVFREKSALQSLKKSMKDLELNHLGEQATENFVMDLQRAVQQCLREHRRPPLIGPELEEYRREILQPLATLAVNGQASLGEIIYVLGNVTSKTGRLDAASKKLDNLPTRQNTDPVVSTEETAPEKAFAERFPAKPKDRQEHASFLTRLETQPAAFAIR